MNRHSRGTREWALEEDRQIRNMLGDGRLEQISKAILHRDALEERAKKKRRESGGGA